MPPIQRTASTAADAYVPSNQRLPIKQFEQKDFLQLLIAQMTAQDPTAPNNDLAFMNQMTSFTAMEQYQVMQDQLDQLQANNLIGRSVVVTLDDRLFETGVVTAVHVEAGKPQVEVNGRAYDLKHIVSITDAVASA